LRLKGGAAISDQLDLPETICTWQQMRLGKIMDDGVSTGRYIDILTLRDLHHIAVPDSTFDIQTIVFIYIY